MANKFDKKRIFEYIFILMLLAVIVFIYIQLADVIKTLFELNKVKDYDQIKTYLSSFGWLGVMVVSLLEMLQMIVVFIPAEFIQVSAGIAYPIYIALPTCMVGVWLGASAIFLITRLLKIKLNILEKKAGKIAEFAKKINKKSNMTIIMLLLFVMPMIPFGAIAYFGSSSDIRYWRYSLVCAFGVIPSILSSYILGHAMIRFIGMGKTNYILALIGLAIGVVVLLLLIAYIIKKIFFAKTLEQPSKFWYGFCRLIFKLKFKKVKATYVRDFDQPFNKNSVVLANHGSMLDFYFLTEMLKKETRINIVANDYYNHYKYTRFFFNKLQAIEKKLFVSDINCVKQLMFAAKNNLTIGLMPEGRLQSSGKPFEMNIANSKMIKKLGIDVYYCHIDGAYACMPKWRNKAVKGDVKVTLYHLYTKEQLKDATVEQITQNIYDHLNKPNNMSAQVDVIGLQNILYKCPHCGAEYTITCTQNSLVCDSCNKEYVFGENYQIDDDKIKNIQDWYDYQSTDLIENKNIELTDSVKIYRMNLKSGKMIYCGQGNCVLNVDGLKLTAQIDGSHKEYMFNKDNMQALAFSCNTQVDVYIDNVLHYIYPSNSQSVAKWSQYYDICCKN